MNIRRIALAGLALLAFIAFSPIGCTSDHHAGGDSKASIDGGTQMTFATPQAAVDALIDDARREDRAALRAIFGPDVERLKSGDKAQDEIDLQRFVASYDLSHFLYDNGNGTYTLVMGLQNWEFPAPIVADGNRWRFDTNAGIDELITRTVGMNELNVIDACAAFCAAENSFFAINPDGDNVLEYARKFKSSPGMRDGLYWPDEPGQPISPLGPLFAQAIATGEIKQISRDRQPYRGYYYRILMSQAAGAPGGAMNYIDDTNHMTRGYAMIAWPASYNETGVMSFIVSKDGIVYQRDLGEKTATDVESITSFDPTGWTPVND